MKISNKLSTVLSFALQFHPDPKEVFRVVKKAVKISFKENKHALKEVLHLTSPKKESVQQLTQTVAPAPESTPLATTPPQIAPLLRNELTERIERLFTAAITLELLIACYTPWDVPKDSMAYPLFFYGTKMLHLEGIFHILASERPSDVRFILAQPLFAAARTTRLIARSLHFCTLLHKKLTQNTQQHLAVAQEEHENALTRVEQAQEDQRVILDSAPSQDTVRNLRAFATRVRAQIIHLNQLIRSRTNAESPEQDS